jgi:hypothetical protein
LLNAEIVTRSQQPPVVVTPPVEPPKKEEKPQIPSKTLPKFP